MPQPSSDLAGVPGPARTRRSAVQSAAMSSARPTVRQREPASPRAIRAYADLARAIEAGELDARRAAQLVRASMDAGTGPAAADLLREIGSTLPEAQRPPVWRQRARLFRRIGRLDSALKQLEALVARVPDDLRARIALGALLARERRWKELDASLEVETRVAASRGAFRRAAHACLSRAELWVRYLGDPARAALRLGQAADYAERARAFPSAFALQLLWVKGLRDSGAPARELESAAAQARRTGARAGWQSWSDEAVRLVASAPAQAEARRASQQALLDAADAAEAAGYRQEAAALLEAAVIEHPDAVAVRRLEAYWLSHRAWWRLCEFYRWWADSAPDRGDRLHALRRLTEVVEQELRDLAWAARLRGELFVLSGDRRELLEQVRLLGLCGAPSQLRKALEEAVAGARDAQARANALVTRAEVALSEGDAARALSDFRAALSASPSRLDAQVGVAEAAAQLGDRQPALALRSVLAALKPRHPERVALYRRFARLAEAVLLDAHLARLAWAEVLVEEPNEAEALARLAELARSSGDAAQLEQALRGRLRIEPKEGARTARIELVALLERTGRTDEAFEELKEAVRQDPAHRQVWIELAEHQIARGENVDALASLEQVAGLSEGVGARRRAWLRVARFAAEALRDSAAAARARARAEAEEGAAFPAPEPVAPMQEDEGLLEGTAGTVEVPVQEAGPPQPSGRRGSDERTPRLEVPVDARPVHLRRDTGERNRTLALIRERPLDPEGYHRLSEYFEEREDVARSSLMAEIASALEGDPEAAPLPPRIICEPSERAGLRHPALRGDAGELLLLSGRALCQLLPTGKAAPREPFHLASGPFAGQAAEALLSAVRILGIRAPDVFLTGETGDVPFSVGVQESPRLLVDPVAVRSAIRPADLRFFAGRALYSVNPDLLLLRTVKRDDLPRAIALLATAVEGEGGEEGRDLRILLGPNLRRIRELRRQIADSLDIDALAQAARHSVNRAGLVVAGGVAPALRGLEAKRASEGERIELLRFAASERYLRLRSPFRAAQ